MKLSLQAVFIGLLITSFPAFAYIDPGSGSAIMSAIIGFFVAVAMAVKTYWYKIKGIFTRKKNDNQDEKPND